MRAAADVLVLPAAVRRSIVAHARRDAPRECCGFLVGRAHDVRFSVSCTNIARSPVRYQVADREHIALRRMLRLFSPAVEIIGVYHSHPAGQAHPSATDLAEAHYDEWFQVIVGLLGRRAAVRAYRFRHKRIAPVALRSDRQSAPLSSFD